MNRGNVGTRWLSEKIEEEEKKHLYFYRLAYKKVSRHNTVQKVIKEKTNLPALGNQRGVTRKNARGLWHLSCRFLKPRGGKNKKEGQVIKETPMSCGERGGHLLQHGAIFNTCFSFFLVSPFRWSNTHQVDITFFLSL